MKKRRGCEVKFIVFGEYYPEDLVRANRSSHAEHS